MKLNCTIKDVEKVLDQQILTLDFQDEQIFYVTKTKKEFSRKDALSIIIHSENVYYFNENGERV